MNEQLVDLLVRDGGFQFVDPAEMAHAKELWHEEKSKIYRALRLDGTPVPLVVMSTVAAVEEFDRLACGSGGALPAFTAAGLVDRMLARLGIAPEVVPPDLPTEIAFFTRPRFTPKGESVDLPQRAAMPEPEKLGERLMPNTPILHRFTPEEALQYGPESVRVKYEFHSFLPVLLSARLHVEGVDVGLSWNQRDQHAFKHPVDLDSLREQLVDPAVWKPQYFSPLYASWRLEWWNPPEYRVLYTGYVAPGPFLDLCLALLKMAGFEFEVRVRPTGNEYHYELSVDP